MSFLFAPVATNASRSEPSAIATFAAAAWRSLHRWHRRRATIRRLHELDDRALDDIGLTRGEVDRAAGLPLEVNASQAVRQMAAERRTAERRLRRR